MGGPGHVDPCRARDAERVAAVCDERCAVVGHWFRQPLGALYRVLTRVRRWRGGDCLGRIKGEFASWLGRRSSSRTRRRAHWVLHARASGSRCDVASLDLLVFLVEAPMPFPELRAVMPAVDAADKTQQANDAVGVGGVVCAHGFLISFRR